MFKTIIECLRYATTGDLPPNSKGGAFIHDPSFGGEKEVLGQIKLAFVNSQGVQMICTRSMQVVAKRATRTFKTLEGQLLALENGERTTVSTRCADLDNDMPKYLGTTRAVLDYVIFCHQEDSLWPLAEPSIVKKRFDEIFEATKFTKALDNIKTLRKEYAIEIKIQEKDVAHLKIEKDRADKATARANRLRMDISSLREEASVLKVEMGQVTTQSNKLFESNQMYQEVLYKLEHIKTAKKLAKENIDRLVRDITEMTESDDELASLLENVAVKAQLGQEKVDESVAELKEEEGKLSRLRQKYNQNVLREGQLKAEANANEENLNRRVEFIEAKCRELDFPQADLSKSAAIENFGDKLQNFQTKLKNDLEKERNSGSRNENAINKRIQELTTEKLREEQKRLSARDIISNSEQEILRLQSQLDQITTDESALDYKRSSLKELELKLASTESSFEQLSIESELSFKQSELVKVEGKVEKHNADLAKYNQQADERATLSWLREDGNKRKSALSALIKANGPLFEKITSKKVDPHTVEADLKSKIFEIQQHVSQMSLELDKAKNEQSQAQTRLKLAEESLASKRVQSIKLREKVTDVLGEDRPITEYDSIVSELQEDMKTCAANLEQSSFTATYFDTAIKLAKEKHKCQLCYRDFEEGEIESFAALVSQRNVSIPEARAQAEQDLADTKTDLEKVIKISPSVSSILQLDDVEIPTVSIEIEELKDILRSAEKESESVSLELDGLKSSLTETEGLRRFASDLIRSQRDIEDIEKQIGDYESRLQDSEASLSSMEIHKILSDLNEQAKTMKKRINQLNEEREKFRSEISYLQNRIGAEKLEVNKLENLINEKASKINQIDRSKSNRVKAVEQSKAADQAIDKVIPLLREQEQVLVKVKFESAEREKAINEEYSKLSQSITEFSGVCRAIETYERKGGDGNLEQCRKDVQDLERQINESSKSIDKFSALIKEEETAIANIRSYERSLRDNLEIRRFRVEVEKLDKEMKQLQVQNAEKERAKYEQEAEKLRQRYARLSSDYSGKLGEAKQMDVELSRINLELKSEFLDVHKQYREAMIKLQTTSVANEDLGKYGKALDNAIMKFHGLKMEEINRIIDELWKKTYTGTDVDTIIIRSDNETTKGNRSYNYRVCMVKQDVELDMRGRCSAGQKVLACIIIRLALSECFGTNCGLVALDEPTTNLDSDNAESLAKSLATIIEVRRAQKNFQLIVITHDEHFLTHMNASSYTDNFYRVSRNNRQQSQIRLVPIGRIME